MNHRTRIFLRAGSPVFLLFFALSVGAQNPFDALQFPIAGLGDCASVEGCKLYCDEPENARACSEWARANGFGSGGRREDGDQERSGEAGGDEERIEHARETLERTTGPGGCSSPEECDVYCSEEAHHDECRAFAREHGFDTHEEERIGPGGCHSEDECQSYCRNPEHTRECVAFGLKNGNLSPEEAARILSQIERAHTIGAEARNRAREAGERVQGEVGERIRGKIERFDERRGRGPRGPRIEVREPKIDEEKARQILETEGGPGGCSTFDACEQFCNAPENGETCMQFALEHDLIAGDEAARMRRLMDSTGPGGCRGRACEQYCEAPGHELECIEHAEGLGLIDPTEAERVRGFMRRGEERGLGCRGRECERYCEDPAHRDQCFEAFKDLIPEEERAHIEKFKAIEARVESAGGPGGCRAEEECHQYCSDSAHFDECAAFAVEAGLFSPEDAEKMLKQFINVENFRGGGPEGVTAPPGFEGFGELGEPPPFEHFEDFELPEGVPPEAREQFKAQFEQGFQGEYRQRFEEEFRARAGRFGEFRQQFGGEGGEHGQFPGGFGAPQGGMPPGGFGGGSGEGGFQGFPQQGGETSVQRTSGGISHISLKTNDSGLFTLRIEDSDGIASFALDPAEGSRYGGDVPNCPRRHESTTVRLSGSFPYTLTYTDCAGNTTERTLSQNEAYGTPTAPPQGSLPGAGTVPVQPPGVGGIPQGFDPRSVGLPEGFQFDGSNIPPEFLTDELRAQIEEMRRRETENQYHEQYQQQSDQQYQQQYNQQYQQQYDQQQQNFTPPEYQYPPPEGTEQHIDSTAPTGFFLSRMIANAARAFLELLGR
ncbi:MAG: hypothetical protein Q8R39_00755 [bacterium]|nr:hypothetical protein [bacterium]